MPTVFVERCKEGSYDPHLISESAPELPGGEATGAAQVLLRRLLAEAGLDASHYGTGAWNPLSEWIRPGETVLIKPNWVYHRNHSGQGLDCLVTHGAVIDAIVRYVIRASPAQITIGDAPIQGCDFAALCRAIGIEELIGRFESLKIAVKDFRLTRRAGESFAAKSLRSERCADQYVEFDLGSASWLEPITGERTEFRVTMYDPDALKRTHSPASHRYLVAREVVEADVIINVPKLKTHRRAGITGALKNVVGIVGAKDYLPHHRKGSGENGGDCYARNSALKSAAEGWLDTANRSYQKRWLTAVLGGAAKLAARVDEVCGGDRNLEGSWYGNDTVWRMVLDLQRLLQFGQLDGSVAPSPVRRVIHITDAIVAGDREGPLFPSAVPLGVMTMASDAAAAEWVHALIMGFDPGKIPLVRHAITASGQYVPSELSICCGGKQLTCDQLREHDWPRFQAPAGWQGHCERTEAKAC